ncbi:hypothetical protein B0H16DRAFT_1459101 [Mycena metata]|uniref:Uncharacterized protein n=1 Tax=Mycena metata TaxID=1033252 RepID=A0AAD7NC23_9AGAR|nr:hypothetical protein B0H16DRAFT_1459101 [Mycena metata]
MNIFIHGCTRVNHDTAQSFSTTNNQCSALNRDIARHGEAIPRAGAAEYDPRIPKVKDGRKNMKVTVVPSPDAESNGRPAAHAAWELRFLGANVQLNTRLVFSDLER